MQKQSVFVRTPFNYDVDKVSLETGTITEGPSLTVQADAEEADINTIVRRFGITGELPLNRRVPLNIDFSEGNVDYRECLDAVKNAEASFATLPADIRKRFDNDPAKLVDFALDPKNFEELKTLGVAPKAAEPPKGEPAKAPAADPVSGS